MNNKLTLLAGIVLFAAMTATAGEKAETVIRTGRVAVGFVEKDATTQWAPAVNPKPLSDNVKLALTWLAKSQQSSGGWAQGEESSGMGSGMRHLKDKPNVGDTCAATLALLRAGNAPGKGAYANNVLRGIAFVCSRVEESDAESLWVTEIKGTRLQMKLGTYIDTFLAALLLAEVRDQMPDKGSRERVAAALDKIMKKMAGNQKSDGTWANQGWAPALAQGLAGKALNRAAQAGAKVDEKMRIQVEKDARASYDKASGKFSDAGSAGVALYATGASLGKMQDSANTNAMMRSRLREQAATAPTAAGREKAKADLERIDATDRDLQAARRTVVKRLEDKRFISGFGSNGGEEFLSYMNIGECLVVKGGQDWTKWDKSMTENLNRIQNTDGSWTGHHCITGRTFCTAVALLVLMTDRAPVPLAAKMKPVR